MSHDAMRAPERDETGFSLVELLVAMTVTMVISGAIYGLLAGGQTAFRREPELSDRQQNIRVAMDMILRDIANAGSGMAVFAQTFTPGLDACAACLPGPTGANTDTIEILTNAAMRDNEPVCLDAGAGAGAASETIQLVRSVAPVAPQSLVLLLMDDRRWTLRNVTAVGAAAAATGNCAAVPHVQLTFATAGDTSGINVGGTLCTPSQAGGPMQLPVMGDAVAPCDVAEVSFGEVVRYRLALDPDGVPTLQRWSSTNPGAGFQVIARGIEDLQFRYAPIGAPPVPPVWGDNAPVVVFDNYATLISQVQVTLGARSQAQNIQGATTAAAGPAAIRGSLVATASPRSTLLALTRQPTPAGPPGGPSPPPVNIWR